MVDRDGVQDLSHVLQDMRLDIPYSNQHVPRGERAPAKVALFGEDGDGGLAISWVRTPISGSRIVEKGGGGTSSLSSLALSFEFPLSAAIAE